MSLSKSEQFKSFMPPAIVNVGSKSYVVPGWHLIPNQTTLDEVYKKWTQDKPKMEDKPTHTISESVESSTKGKFYTVSFDGSNWNCECVGFGFRRDCKHIKLISNKYKNGKN